MAKVPRYRSRNRTASLVVIFAVTAAAHAAVVASIDLSIVTTATATEAAEAAPDKPFAYSCTADAALAAGARLAFCGSPLATDRDECTKQALIEFENRRTECHAVEVAFDPSLIRPEPLVPDIAPAILEDIVAAQLIDDEIAEQLEEEQKQQQPEEQQQAMVRPQPPPPQQQAQVVEITETDSEEPENARFLSDYNSKVEKETVARGSTEEMVERPAPRELPPSPDNPPTPEEITAPERERVEVAAVDKPEGPEGPEGPGEPSDKEQIMAMRGPGTGDRAPNADRPDVGPTDGLEEISASEGQLPRRGETPLPPRDSSDEPVGGETAEAGGGGGGGARPIPDLRPSEEVLERAIGGGSVDKLDGVEDGENTALNSRQWKFASFFNRMKRQVAQNWHPDKVYLRRDPTGKKYGAKDRLTVLKVSLTPEGKLANVFIVKQSGIDFLDEEATRAFREAQPFPNPPSGLIDAESQLITFSFGFHFQIGDRSGWKIFRQ